MFHGLGSCDSSFVIPTQQATKKIRGLLACSLKLLHFKGFVNYLLAFVPSQKIHGTVVPRLFT
jgi:hypothetical protein